MLWPIVWMVSKPGVVVLSKTSVALLSWESAMSSGFIYVSGMASLKIGENIYKYFFSVPPLENSPLVKQEQQMQEIKENLLQKAQPSRNEHQDNTKNIEQVVSNVDEIKKLILKIRENTQPLLIFLNELKTKEGNVEFPHYYLELMIEFIKKIQACNLEELVQELKQSRDREEHLSSQLNFFVSKFEQQVSSQAITNNLS